MRNLVEGECGGSNALVRATDHLTSRLGHRELLHQQHGLQGISPHQSVLHGESAFRMDALLNTIPGSHQQGISQVRHVIPQAVTAFHSNVDTSSKLWAHEFVAGKQSNTSSSAQVHPQAMRSMYRPSPSINMMMNQRMMFQPQHSMQFHNNLQHQQQSEDHLLPQPFLEEQEIRLKREHEQLEEQRSKAKEFLELKEEVHASTSRQEDQRQESDRIKDQEKDDLAFWNNLAQEWEGVADTHDAYSFLGDYDSVTTEPFSDGYYFKDDNPHVKETPNAFEEGMRKLESGDIPSAVLLFEASVQQKPSDVKAWQFLGTTQALNEHDPAAIRALKRALELDPNNLTALMALAVSYTNESYQKQACEALAQWISVNPAYAAITSQVGLDLDAAKNAKEDHPMIVSSVVSSKLFNQVKEAFIKAALMCPSGPMIDPDVQSGLGVLLNLTGEYDKAVQCFESALSVRPEDALLWNRLGATLANGNRSSEAVAAYMQALQLSPGFIRSRFNLGISCINLNSYNEAAEHFLYVLNLQNNGRGLDSMPSSSRNQVMSNNVWTSMRMVLSLMNRQDLYDAVESRDLNRLNREFNMTEFTGGSRTGKM